MQDTLPVAKEQVRLGRSGLVVQYFIAPVRGSHELHSAIVMSSQAHEARCVAHITPVCVVVLLNMASLYKGMPPSWLP